MQKGLSANKQTQQLQHKRRLTMKRLTVQKKKELKEAATKGVYPKCVRWKKVAWNLIHQRRANKLTWQHMHTTGVQDKQEINAMEIVKEGLQQATVVAGAIDADRDEQQTAIKKRLAHKRKMMKLNAHFDPQLHQKRERRKTIHKLQQHVEHLETKLQRVGSGSSQPGSRRGSASPPAGAFVGYSMSPSPSPRSTTTTTTTGPGRGVSFSFMPLSSDSIESKSTASSEGAPSPPAAPPSDAPSPPMAPEDDDEFTL
eukprot:TRINITY_DN115762_c0_g1_i1.p1 TRINITY_DN115762_c0_g1~~TRINITY_DN115762_c0_g1_i1.p1  ORF type:complete len:283 (-),score=53.54 TRINITY_DN115762_c0_g1_i1:38-805(-)